MADFTASTKLRNLLADSAAAYYYWATLHDSNGSTLAAGDTYTAGIKGELATANGYDRGTKTVDYTHATSDGLLTAADAVWTATGGSIGPASYAGDLGVGHQRHYRTAGLLSVDDMTRQSADGYRWQYHDPDHRPDTYHSDSGLIRGSHDGTSL